MINKTMQDALNAQINAEQYSAQLYLAMSAAMEAKSFRGFAQWFRVQAAEETRHAMKLIDFVLDRGGKLELQALPAPSAEFGGPIQAFEEALKHEQIISAKINALFELARSGKDYASEITLQWFVSEQIEEEASAGLIVSRLHAVGDQGGAIWYLDKELGKRAKAD
jgi:ferritin